MPRHYAKRSASPMATMMIFMCIILIATVAGYLIVQQGQKLVSESSKKSKVTAAGASTAMITVKLYGQDGRDGTLEDFYQQIIPQPGSAPIELVSLLVTVQAENGSSDLIYSPGPCVYDGLNRTAGLDGFWTNHDSGFFTARIIRNATHPLQGFLTEGEILELCYHLPYPAQSGDNLYIRLKSGSSVSMAEPVAIPFVMDQVERLKN